MNVFVKKKKTKRRREKKKSRVSMGRVRKKRRVKRIGSLKCLRAVFVGVGGRGRGVEEVRPGRTRGAADGGRASARQKAGGRGAVRCRTRIDPLEKSGTTSESGKGNRVRRLRI